MCSVVAYLSWAEQIVEVLQKWLFLDFVVSEDKSNAIALQACHSVQEFEVIHQITGIVRPGGIGGGISPLNME